VRRREFITLLGGAAVGWSLAASAQTRSKIRRVGIVFSSTPMANKHLVEAFRQGLRELGYVEGQTILLEIRWAEGRPERARQLVTELVGLNVDVLVAPTGPAALAAKNATQTIPIVMSAIDPVGLGLIGSLSRPGGNVTGLSYYNEAIAAKKLELLKEIVPGLARVGVLRNPLNPGDPLNWKETEVAAQRLGVVLEALEVRGPEDFEAAFATAKQRNAQALLDIVDLATFPYRSRITALAASSRLPAMYGSREFPDAGGLMSYGPSNVLIYRGFATFVDKILKGAKPAELPVEQPTKFELVINVKIAKALGLTIPPTLFARADELIE
jgi:putative tryptophan/tyrosine transport system substrate-binding protein